MIFVLDAYLMVEQSKLYKRSQDTSDLPYEAECLLGAGLLHPGAQGQLQHPGDGGWSILLAL